MQLRAHHLLCTQGYSGKGYSDGFVSNMDQIVEQLRGENATEIQIVCSTDDLCGSCPNMLGVNHCEDDSKVKVYDRKVMEYFGLEEKTYIYQELIQQIDEKMTSEMLDDICGNCGWYPVSSCKKNILGE